MLTRLCRGCGRVVKSADGSAYWHPSCKSAAEERDLERQRREHVARVGHDCEEHATFYDEDVPCDRCGGSHHFERFYCTICDETLQVSVGGAGACMILNDPESTPGMRAGAAMIAGAFGR